MKQDDDNEFWSRLGETLRPRLTEAQWTAQRGRIFSRLTPEKPRRLMRWTAAAALAGLAGLWFLLPGGKNRTPITEPAQDSTWDARITMVQGQVTVFARGGGEGVPAEEGTPLEEGDTVRTGSDGSAEVALSTNSVIDLSPDSVVTLSNLKPKQTLLDLDLGTLVAKLRWKGSPGWRLDVRTPTAVAAVRGTEFGVSVQEGGETTVGVFDEGKVAVRTTVAPSIEETMLNPHQEIRVPPGPRIETEMKDGRSYLRVNELSRLKPYQEQIERIRERPQALSRTWKDLGRPAREKVRARMAEEHQRRMLALPPGVRQSMKERLRRPERAEGRRGRTEGMRPGPVSRDDKRGFQPDRRIRRDDNARPQGPQLRPPVRQYYRPAAAGNNGGLQPERRLPRHENARPQGGPNRAPDRRNRAPAPGRVRQPGEGRTRRVPGRPNGKETTGH